MEIINFIGLLALIWYFVTGAAPVQFLKKLLEIDTGTKTKSLVKQVLSKLVNCALCSGFWIGIMYHFGLIPSFILYASFVGITAELFLRIVKFLFNNVFNHL